MGARGSGRRKGGVRAVGKAISERDIEILRFVGEQYLIDDRLLAQLRGANQSTNRRWRRKYVAERFIVSRRILPKRVFVWLTRRGLNQVGLSYRYMEPAIGRIEHTIAVATVRICVERSFKKQGLLGYAWICERELAKDISKGSHRPDAEMVLEDGRTVAIEIELTIKRRQRLCSIIDHLNDQYDAVWYFAYPKPKRLLERLAEKHNWESLQIIDLPRLDEDGNGGKA